MSLSQVFNKSVPRAVAGDNVGILLRGVKREFVDRGMYLSVPGNLQQTDHFAARLYVLTHGEGGRSKPVTSGFSNLAYISTWTSAARVEFDDRPMAMPGDLIDRAELILHKPMVVREGQRFVVREYRQTVISGVITEWLAESGREIVGFNYKRASKAVIESNASVLRKKKSTKAGKATTV